MTAPPYAAFFYGQGPLWGLEWGGSLTSMGVTRLVAQARAMSIESDCYTFGPTGIAKAKRKIIPALRQGRPLILLGYSLGVTSITYLQTKYPCALLLALAGSKLGQNSTINRRNTKRAVLWRDPNSIFSGAGAELGFDVVHDIPGTLHLLFDFDPRVIGGVLDELKAFMKARR